MSKPDVAGWIAKADSDRLNIENNLRGNRIPWDTVCYHAQQIAEKMLKACLVSRAMTPPRTHDLIRLLRECRDAGVDLSELADDCSLLLQHAALSRYPGSFHYTEQLGREAVEASERVHRRLMEVLAPAEGAQ